jgi:hypothetical protein
LLDRSVDRMDTLHTLILAEALISSIFIVHILYFPYIHKWIQTKTLLVLSTPIMRTVRIPRHLSNLMIVLDMAREYKESNQPLVDVSFALLSIGALPLIKRRKKDLKVGTFIILLLDIIQMP